MPKTALFLRSDGLSRRRRTTLPLVTQKSFTRLYFGLFAIKLLGAVDDRGKHRLLVVNLAVFIKDFDNGLTLVDLEAEIVAAAFIVVVTIGYLVVASRLAVTKSLGLLESAKLCRLQDLDIVVVPNCEFLHIFPLDRDAVGLKWFAN